MVESYKIPQFNELTSCIEQKRKLPAEEKDLLKKSFDFSQKAHAKQKRRSGEPYFTHPFKAALTLAEWNMDTPTICAGLLHDTIEDTEYTFEDIKKLFGEEIAFLVSGVTKLGKLKYRGEKTAKEIAKEIESAKIKRRSESLRKMILAVSEDLRVIFIKLADRLHNMKTLKSLPPQKQARIALETSEIYASLAYRLGMQNLSGELEDLAFPYIHPKEYKWIKENVGAYYENMEGYLKNVKPIVEQALHKNGIKPVNIDYRSKRISSLYKKLSRYDMNVGQIYDLMAMRIIVNTVEECYAALGTIHQLWPPLPGKIKDYIALPKPNGYKSLHTTVFCVDNKVTEFQIRTTQMHEEAENGIAAHWAYSQAKTTKDYKESKAIFADKKELKWVQQLREWQKDLSDPLDFLNSLKIDFFKDRVFGITPKGEVIDLPAGSTPVDFAYQIHSSIGDQCTGAKVNGKIVSLDYKVQSGDIIDILVQKNKRPSESWLNFVKTEGARRKIKSSIHKEAGLFTNLSKKSHQTEIKITASDRIGLFKDVAAVVSRSHINISEMNVPKTTGFPTIKITCDITDKEKIEKLIFKIKDVEGVKEVNYRLL